MSGDHNMYASGSGDGQRSGWRKRTIMEMAREAGFVNLENAYWDCTTDGIEAFAEQVRADERNRTWTQEHWTEYENSIAAAEREACQALQQHEDVLAPVGNSAWGEAYQEGWAAGTAAYLAAIRARGQA